MITDGLSDIEIAVELTKEFKAAPPIHFQLDAGSAYELIGLLQLALRHPQIGLEHPRARAFVEDVVRQLALIGPFTAETMRMGFDTSHDRPR